MRSNDNPKSYVIAQIGQKNYDHFLRWAFGSDFDENIALKDIPEIWNKLHTDSIIKLHDEVKTSTEMMVKLYKEEFMDKKIKKLQKDTKKIMKEESSLLKEDKRHDKVIEKAKKNLKKK